jgi:hypothetical protein
MASSLYNSFTSGLMNGVFNLNSDVIKVALMNNLYPAVFNVSQTKWSDVSTYEISSSNPTVNYTAGGNTISCSVIDAASTAQFNTTGTDGNGNCTWVDATIVAYGAVIYDSSAVNSPLIAWIDFGGVQSSTNGNFVVSWASVSDVIVSING